jgi:hypothetical protein
MKIKTTIVALLAALLIIPGAANSATIIFDNLVADSGAGTLTFDILAGDMDLANVAAWNLEFDITRIGSSADFSFSTANVSTDANYLFLGRAGSYQTAITPAAPALANSFNFYGNDIDDAFAGVTDFMGKLLARFTIDTYTPGDVFDIALNASQSFFLDIDFASESITPLVYQVPVPVPAAVWLLGSGLMGLIAIRRKR